jgi:hypothetical protein
VSDEILQRYKRELERAGMSPRDVALGMLHFYRLRWATEDEEMQFVFASAEKRSNEEFQVLCNSLVPEASRRAVDRSTTGGVPNFRHYVGWGEIVVHVAVMLEDRGFIALNPIMIAAGFEGSTIIDSERCAVQDDGTRCPDFVIAHNAAALGESGTTRGRPGGGGAITISGGASPGTGTGGEAVISLPGGEEPMTLQGGRDYGDQVWLDCQRCGRRARVSEEPSSYTPALCDECLANVPVTENTEEPE